MIATVKYDLIVSGFKMMASVNILGKLYFAVPGRTKSILFIQSLLEKVNHSLCV